MAVPSLEPSYETTSQVVLNNRDWTEQKIDAWKERKGQT